MKKTSTPFYKTGVSRSPFEMHEPGHTLDPMGPHLKSSPPKQKPTFHSMSKEQDMRPLPNTSKIEALRSRPEVRSVNEVGSRMGDAAGTMSSAMEGNQSWQGELKSSQKKEPLSKGVQKVKDRQTKRTIKTLQIKNSIDQQEKERLQKKQLRKEGRRERKLIRNK